MGDDAQSIYSFRGANIRNILNLKKAYPDLRIFKLEQNYRSTRNIVSAANSLIDKNSEQIRKEVFSENDFGSKIEVCRCYSDFDEASLVADRISRLQMTNHDSLNDFAILYRTNAQSRHHAASERGISVWGVLNDPADLSVNSGTLKKLEAFRQMIAGFNELDSKGTDAAELSRAIYTRTGLLTSLISDNTPESVSQQENLMEMQRNVEEFVAGRMEEGNEAVRMCDFLSEVSLATDQDEKDTSEERVTLMTVHAAKGLEFKNVMVVGVEEELFPSALACVPFRPALRWHHPRQSVLYAVLCLLAVPQRPDDGHPSLPIP